MSPTRSRRRSSSWSAKRTGAGGGFARPLALGVSRRVSVRARLAASRRSAREVQGVESAAAPDSRHGAGRPPRRPGRGDRPAPREVSRGGGALRLEGLSHDEAARQMGCARRDGQEPAESRPGKAPLAADPPWHRAHRPWRVRGVRVRRRSRQHWRRRPSRPRCDMRRTSGGWVVSAAVTDLTQGVLRAMFLNKLGMVAVIVIAGLALATGAAVVAQQAASPPSAERAGRRPSGTEGWSCEGRGDPSRSPATPPDDSSREEDDHSTGSRHFAST